MKRKGGQERPRAAAHHTEHKYEQRRALRILAAWDTSFGGRIQRATTHADDFGRPELRLCAQLPSETPKPAVSLTASAQLAEHDDGLLNARLLVTTVHVLGQADL